MNGLKIKLIFILSTLILLLYHYKLIRIYEFLSYTKNDENNFDSKSGDDFDPKNYLIEFCKLSKYTFHDDDLTTSNSSATPKTTNITLLVTFNKEIRLSNMIFLKHIHSDYFKNIIFCGKTFLNQPNDDLNVLKKFDSFTFILMDTVNGYFHYYCMTKAIEMNVGSDGILLMSDDVLLKSWHLHKFDKNKIWYPFAGDICSHEIYKGNPKLISWECWRTYMGVEAVLNLWDYFAKARHNSISIVEKENLNLIASFTSRLANISANQSSHVRVCVQGSDFFYLNSKNFKAFHFFSSLFRRFNVFLEIAVPTILIGIEDEKNMFKINGSYNWSGQIDLNEYDKIGYFGHPVKISQYYKSEKGKIFCQKFIKDKLSHL